ncbi:MAG TPA: response regulator [Desulfobacterales bacterium]|nr:response regulator [Desulfobacterales bacterium]
MLIVDDDLQIQKLLTNMLSEHQYETEVTADGFEASFKVIEFKPDLKGSSIQALIRTFG